MVLLELLELIALLFLVFEIGIPMMRDSKLFPVLRSLRFRRKLAKVNMEIDNEKIILETKERGKKLKSCIDEVNRE